MKLFLLYKELEPAGLELADDDVARRLRSIFARVYDGLSEPAVRKTPAGTLVHMELPVRGWKGSFLQEEAGTWCLAPDYPVDAERALRAVGAVPAGKAVLPRLCRELEARPRPLLAELAPPFSVVWSPAGSDDLLLQNDGVGRSQLYETQADGIWALSNRVFAFRALGLPLRPAPLDWAVRWCVGHHLGDMTGFRDVRFLDPGTRIRLTRAGMERERFDVLGEWIGGDPGAPHEALELARASLSQQVETGAALLEEPRLGLTGGWDSRVIASALHHAGVPFAARVRGETWRSDVVIASRIAALASVPLTVQHRKRKLPPPTAAECRQSMQLSLLLSAGGRTTRSYKAYLSPERRLRAGRAEITGHGGEVAREYYGSRIRRGQGGGETHDQQLVRYLTKRTPPFLHPSLREAAAEVIRDRCRRADDYDLQGSARWRFFYLRERERRFIGSHGVARTGLELMPFLAPGFLRASFRLPAEETQDNPVHRYILEHNAPDWLAVPFKADLPERPPDGVDPEADEASAADAEAAPWRRPEGRHAYDNAAYWQSVGRPLIEECLARPGFWTELFDADEARRGWAEAPDELVLSALLPELCGA